VTPICPPRFATAQALEAAQGCSIDASDDPVGATNQAWHLRQADSVRAVDIARAMLLRPAVAWKTPLAPQLAGWLKLVLAEASWLHSDIAQAIQLVDQAQALFEASQCHQGLSDVHWLRAHFGSDGGAMADRDQAMRSALSHAEAALDTQRTASCRLALACFAAFDDDRAAADANALLVEPYTRSDDPGLRLLANTFFVAHHFVRHQPAQAIEHGLASRAAAIECGQFRRAIMDGADLANYLLDIHELDLALQHTQESLELARRCQWSVCLSTAMVAMSRCLLLLGRLESARNTAAEAIVHSRKLRHSRPYHLALICQGDAELASGELDGAETAFVEVLEVCREKPDPPILGYAYIGLAGILHRRGRIDEAYGQAGRALQAARKVDDPVLQVSALRLMAALSAAMQACAQEVSPRPEVESEQVLLESAASLAAQSQAMEGHDQLLLDLAQAKERSGDLGGALRALKQACDAQKRLRSADIANRAIGMEVRFRTEQARMEARLQRQAAEVEARRSTDLENLNRQLHSALGELQQTQELLLRRNDELTQAYGQINELSLTDPLTGLRNRRFFSQVIDNSVAETLRSYSASNFTPLDASLDDPRQDLILFMIDIDLFKSVNDQFGHSAGDRVLVQLRDRLRTVAREEDHLVRWGGRRIPARGPGHATPPRRCDRRAPAACRRRHAVRGRAGPAHPQDLFGRLVRISDRPAAAARRQLGAGDRTGGRAPLRSQTTGPQQGGRCRIGRDPISRLTVGAGFLVAQPRRPQIGNLALFFTSSITA
jgi:GGDEF domain-containing protein